MISFKEMFLPNIILHKENVNKYSKILPHRPKTVQISVSTAALERLIKYIHMPNPKCFLELLGVFHKYRLSGFVWEK